MNKGKKMTNLKTDRFNLVAAGILAFSAMATNNVHAAPVTGNATITIDKTAFASTSNGWDIPHFFDASFNEVAINGSTPGGTTSTSNMLFSVNTNSSTISYAAVNRTLQKTTMDSNDASVGQIGLSGALTMFHPSLGNLAPYDFSLQKYSGTWNLVTHDQSFQGTTFFQLTNVSESVDVNGQLALAGDLIWGTNFGSTTHPSPFGLTWASFLQVPTQSRSTVVGHLSLAAVPVPAAVWLFGSGLLGLAGISRRKLAITA
jgi:hypothetical protein